VADTWAAQSGLEEALFNLKKELQTMNNPKLV
jgi:hypothetical protein